MFKLSWATDIHLDHAVLPAREIGKRLRAMAPSSDALLLTGDISVADSLAEHLLDLLGGYEGTIYFVLGNHDVWGSSFAAVHREMARLSAGEPSLVWLRRAGVVRLTERTALVGHDGLYDAGYGEVRGGICLNDIHQVDELRPLHPARRIEWLRENGRRMANEARGPLREALSLSSNVVFATHVPPFPEICTFRGEPTVATYLPWYTNRAMGEMLLMEAERWPGARLTVLAGHTHGAITAQIENIHAEVGGASYGDPGLARVLELP